MIKSNILFFLCFWFPVAAMSAVHEIKTLNKSQGEEMIYEPSYLHVKVGDTIRFVPVDPGHTSRSLFTPNGAETWAGENSKEVTVTLSKEGVYLYECQNHGIMGMLGVIQVGQATNYKEAQDFFIKHKNKIIMNKQRLDQLLEKIKK